MGRPQKKQEPIIQKIKGKTFKLQPKITKKDQE